MSDAPAPLSSLRRIVLTLFPWLILSGFHTYTVGKVNGDGTVNLDPPLKSPLQPLSNVSQWLIGGGVVTPIVGSEVVIVYRDNDESKPAIVSFTPLSASTPTKVSIDANTVNLGGAGAVKLAKAPNVANELNVLKDALSTSATHVVPNDGGAALIAFINTALESWPGSVATTKVEGV